MNYHHSQIWMQACVIDLRHKLNLGCLGRLFDCHKIENPHRVWNHTIYESQNLIGLIATLAIFRCDSIIALWVYLGIRALESLYGSVSSETESFNGNKAFTKAFIINAHTKTRYFIPKYDLVVLKNKTISYLPNHYCQNRSLVLQYFVHHLN